MKAILSASCSIRELVLLIILIASSLTSCGKQIEQDRAANSSRNEPTVEIVDSNIESCAEVYHYLRAALELGNLRVRINGHSWIVTGPNMNRSSYDLKFDLDPTGLERNQELEIKLKTISPGSALVWLELSDEEPAKTLFQILDLLEETGHSYWINSGYNEGADTNTFKVFLPKIAPPGIPPP